MVFLSLFHLLLICKYFSGGILTNKKISKSPSFQEIVAKVKLEAGKVAAFNFAPFIPKIVSELKTLKDSAGKELEETWDLRKKLQAIQILFLSAHKLLHVFFGWAGQEDVLYETHKLLADSLPTAFAAPSEEPDSSMFASMITHLDELIFLPPIKPAEIETTVAYVDGLARTTINAIALKCYRSLIKLLKFFRQKTADHDTIWFPSLFKIVRKRLETAELDAYTTSLLPTYSCQILLLAGAHSNDPTGERLNLARFALERCGQICEEIIQKGQLDALLKESKRNHFAKEQLYSYYLPHFMLIPKSIEEDAWFLDNNFSCDVDLDEFKSQYSLQNAIKNFKFDQELDPKKKQLLSFLFYMFVGNMCYVEVTEGTEDEQKVLAELVNYYYTPKTIDFRFLHHFMKYIRYSLPFTKVWGESLFAKQTQMVDIWFGESLFECDCGASLPSTGRRRFLIHFPDWRELPMYRPYLRAQNGNHESDDEDEPSNETMKNQVIRLITILQDRIEKFDELTIEMIQGKLDHLRLGMPQRLLEVQLDIFAFLFDTCKGSLSKDQKKEIATLLFNLFNGKLGVLRIPRSIEEAIIVQNEGIPILWTTDTYFEIIYILINPNVIQYASQGQFKSLDKGELKGLARINKLSMYFDVDREEALREQLAQLAVFERQKLHEDERFDPKMVLEALYNLVLPAIKEESNLSNITTVPVYFYGSESKVVKREIKKSLAGYLLYGLVEGEESFFFVQPRAFESAEQFIQGIISELNAFDEKSSIEEITPVFQRLEGWICVINLLCNALDELTFCWMTESSFKGWSELLQARGLTQTLSAVVKALSSEKLLENPHSPEIRKNSAKSLHAIIELFSDLKEKCGEIDGWLSSKFMPNEKNELLASFTSMTYKLFLEINLSSITFLTNREAIPKDVQIYLFSLLFQRELQDDFQEQIPEDLGADNEEEIGEDVFDFPMEELGSLTLSEVQATMWKKFVSQNYKLLIPQLLLASGFLESSELHILEKTVVSIFGCRASQSKKFKKYLLSLREEADVVFQAFISESPEKLHQFKLKALPSLQANSESGACALLSALLFVRFYQMILSSVPENRRAFLPTTLSDTPIMENAPILLANFSNIADKELKESMTLSNMADIMSVLKEGPTKDRVKLISELYSLSQEQCREEEQLKKLDQIYSGIKKSILNSILYDESVIKMECNSLLALLIWEKSYREQALKDGLFAHLFTLKGDVKTTVVPFILELFIDEQVPPEIRIEIALKAALLRTANIGSMKNKEMIAGLNLLMQAYPKLFIQKFHEIFTIEELPNDARKSNQEEEKEEEKEKGEEIKNTEPKQSAQKKTKLADNYRITIKKGKGNWYLITSD